MKKKSIALLASTGLAGLVAGGVLMGTMSANAADDSGPSSAATTSSGTPGQPPAANGAGVGLGDPTKPMRSDETLLAGDTKEKVTAAVKAKYPDATFQRVETDSDGVYEAHVLVDGKPLTVEVGKNFQVTGTESMPAAPPGRAGGSPGQPPSA